MFLALKPFENQLLNQNLLISTDNSSVVAYLNKQGGTHLQEMCALIWRIMAWTNVRGIQIRTKHIPRNLSVLADSLSREDKVIQTESSSVQSDLPLLTSTNGRFVCNKVESQASNVCVSCPQQSGLGNRCIEHLLVGYMDAYVFCPVALIPQVIQKMTTYRCRIMIAPGWPGMYWFWDLVDLSTKLPQRLPLWVKLLTQPFSNRLHNNLAYLNLHAWHLESVMNIQEDSQWRWRSELRSLRATPQGESMNQDGPFLGSGVKRARWTSEIPLFQM